jgi:type VI secretion system protein ImpL
MKTLIGFFKQRAIIQLVGIMALCTLVWFAGPWVAIAGRTPLQPEFNRLLAILCIVVIWVLYLLFTQARASRADRQLIADLSAPVIDPETEAISKAQDEEVTELGHKFEDALQRLKKARATGKRDTRYLYELPWYVIIGAPGSGKTTALLNSGLKFPVSDRPGRYAVQGIGGTRNCDWFFADEAIFIDTAGRYTTQDSHQAVDQAAWRGFLELIKKHRPRRPINGVLVTMSMSDLLQRDEHARSRHAMDMRQRIQELYEILKVRFPIYMLFTKCDLIAGFTDFFADLNAGARAQVWGETFPGEDSTSNEDRFFGFDTHFDALMKRLNQRTFRRIQEERDLPRRAQILDFPQQMALLKPALMRFLDDVFAASRYDTEPYLRGVYFTSGTQEGTPIDRVLGRLADAYGFDRQHQPVFSGRGKSFFITRLLRDVVIPEAALAGIDQSLERHRRKLQSAAYACLLALVIGMTALWTISYTRNKNAIEAVNHQVDQYRVVRKQTTASVNRGMMPLLARLDVLKAANDVYQHPSVWMRFGLYQGEKLQSEINRDYRKLLKSHLLPLIQTRLERRLRLVARMFQSIDPELPYMLLKSYLMLGDPEKLDPQLVGAIIAKEWAYSYSRQPRVQSELIAHTHYLLNERNWLDPIALDTALVSDVRRKLNAIPLSMQIYAHLKSEAFADTSHDFRLSDHLGRYGDRVFDKKSIREGVIPGIYTRDGYTTFFKMQGLAFVKKALAQNWVLENPAADQAGDLNRLYDDLEKLYFAEYEKRWRALLSDLRIRRAQSLNDSIQILDILSSPDTPIRPLLEAVEVNTALSTNRKAGSSADKKEQSQKNTPTGFSLSQMLPSVNAPLPLREMERHFQDLNLLVQGTKKSPPPLDQILSRLANLRDNMLVISDSANSNAQALKVVRERMSGTGASDNIKLAKLEFSRLPDPLRTWFLSLIAFGWNVTLNSARSELNSIWRQEVLTPYRSGLDRRYPLFANSAYDATLADFSRFFAPNGIIDRYFQEHLKPFVDTSRSPWRQVSSGNRGMGLSRAALRQFQYAAKIRQTLFADGGQSPSIQFELRPISLDENLAAFQFFMEGQTLVYSHGPIRSTQFKWPGPDTELGVRLTYQTLDGREIHQAEEGPWALFRILDQSQIDATAVPDRFRVTFRKAGYRARFELRASSANNPFMLLELKRFRCPGDLR